MKKPLILALLSTAIASSASAQTAMDWTKNDCDSVAHTLFSELDSGYCIILEFVMVPSCSPCYIAAGYIADIRAQFETTHPGRVRHYTIAYNNSYTCSDMQNWESMHGLTPDAMFIQGSSEVAYYGGMGMPTIVVVGTTNHTVFFQKQGFSPSDTTSIKNALNQALAGASGISDALPSAFEVTLSPNPAGDLATISIVSNDEKEISVELMASTGAKVMDVFSGQVHGARHFDLSLSQLPVGLYLLTIRGEHDYEAIALSVQR